MLVSNPSLRFAKWASTFAMVCGLASLVIMRLMWEEIIESKDHLGFYTALQWLVLLAIVFTSLAFLMDRPFKSEYQWWPLFINWVGLFLYLNTFRHVCMAKYRVYSIWWFW